MPIFAVCGPSGAGKDTLIDAIEHACPDIHIVRRVVTRPVDAGGEQYTSVDEHTFAMMQERGDFVLSWRAHGLCYGIPVSARIASETGKVVVFNASRAALDDAARVFDGLRVLLVNAHRDVLAQRLHARGREDVDDINRRLERAQSYNVPPYLDVHKVDNNGTIDEAVRAALAVLYPSGAR